MTVTAGVPPSSHPQPGLQNPLPGARAALVLLLAINLFNYLDRYVLAAVVTNIKDDFFKADSTGPAAGTGSVATALLTWLQHAFGLGEYALIGSLAMAFMVTYMLTAPLFGWLAERTSRWLLVGIGVIIWSLASGASGLARHYQSFEFLFLTRCLVGIGEAAYGPIAPTMISDLYPVKVRGSVLAWFYMAIPVGSALGFAFGGLILGLGLGWDWAFYLVMPPGLILGVWCFFMPEPPRGQADLAQPGGEDLATRGGGNTSIGETRRVAASPRSRVAGSPGRTKLGDYLVLWRTPSYVLDTLGMTAMTFAVGGIAFWMPHYIGAVRQAGNLGAVNLTFGGIVVVSGLVATLLGGVIGDKLRPRYPGSYFLVSGIAMLLAFPFSIWMLYAPFPLAWLVIFLACFCLFFNTGPTNTILANVTHPAIRATGFAVNIFVIHALGDVISPLIIGAITDADPNKDMNTAFLVVSAMILLGGFFWLWGTRYLERDTALAPHRLGDGIGERHTSPAPAT